MGKPKVTSELGVGTMLEMVKQSCRYGGGEGDSKQRNEWSKGIGWRVNGSSWREAKVHLVAFE